jgi:hypothetical protein
MLRKWVVSLGVFVLVFAWSSSVRAGDYTAILEGRYGSATLVDPAGSQNDKLYVDSGSDTRKLEVKYILPLLEDPGALYSIKDDPKEQARNIHAATLIGRHQGTPCIYRVYGKLIVVGGGGSGMTLDQGYRDRFVFLGDWRADFKQGDNDIGVALNNWDHTNDDYIVKGGLARAVLFLTKPIDETKYVIKVYDTEQRVLFSFLGSEPAASTTVELGRIAPNQWLDWRGVQLTHNANGTTTIKAEYPATGDVTLKGHADAKCLELYLAPVEDLNGGADGRGDLPPVPVNASYTEALNGTDKVGEVKYALRAVGPAGTYKFKVGRDSRASVGRLSGASKVLQVQLAGAGNDIPAFSTDHVVLKGEQECSGEGDAAGIKVYMGEDPEVNGCYAIEQKVITFKLVGKLSPVTTTPWSGGLLWNGMDTATTTIPADSDSKYANGRALPNDDLKHGDENAQGWKQVADSATYCKKAYNVWQYSGIEDAGTLTLAAFTGDFYDNPPWAATVAAFGNQRVKLSFETVPANMISGYTASVDFDAKRSIQGCASADAQGDDTDDGAVSVSVAHGIVSIGYSGPAGGKDASAVAGANWCWYYKEPGGGAFVKLGGAAVPGVMTGLSAKAVPAAGDMTPNIKTTWPANAPSLVNIVSTFTVQTGTAELEFRAAVGAARKSVDEIADDDSRASVYFRAEKPSIDVKSASITAAPSP